MLGLNLLAVSLLRLGSSYFILTFLLGVVASRIADKGRIVTIAAGNDGADGSWVRNTSPLYPLESLIISLCSSPLDLEQVLMSFPSLPSRTPSSLAKMSPSLTATDLFHILASFP